MIRYMPDMDGDMYRSESGYYVLYDDVLELKEKLLALAEGWRQEAILTFSCGSMEVCSKELEKVLNESL